MSRLTRLAIHTLSCMSAFAMDCHVVQDAYLTSNCCESPDNSVTGLVATPPQLFDLTAAINATVLAGDSTVPATVNAYTQGRGLHGLNGITIYGEYIYAGSVGGRTVLRIHRTTGQVTSRTAWLELDGVDTAFSPDDVTVVNNKLYIASLFRFGLDGSFLGTPLTNGAMLSLDLSIGFESAPFKLITLSPMWTNPVNGDGNTVVFGTAFGSNFLGTGDIIPARMTVLKSLEPSDCLLCDDQIVKQFDLVFPGTDKPAYFNNFAVDGKTAYIATSTSGGTNAPVNELAGYWSAGEPDKFYFASVDLDTGAMTLHEKIPFNYSLAMKRVNSRTFLLGEDVKVHERHPDGTYTVVKDIMAEYNSLGVTPLVGVLGAEFGKTFTDNMAVESYMDKLYFTISIGKTLYSFVA